MPRQWDVGTKIVLTVTDRGRPVSLAGGTAKILFSKPNGQVIEKSATIIGDGSTGQIQYLTVVGDLDVAGPWSVEGVVTLAQGNWGTVIKPMVVHPRLRKT